MSLSRIIGLKIRVRKGFCSKWSGTLEFSCLPGCLELRLTCKRAVIWEAGVVYSSCGGRGRAQGQHCKVCTMQGVSWAGSKISGNASTSSLPCAPCLSNQPVGVSALVDSMDYTGSTFTSLPEYLDLGITNHLPWGLGVCVTLLRKQIREQEVYLVFSGITIIQKAGLVIRMFPWWSNGLKAAQGTQNC